MLKLTGVGKLYVRGASRVEALRGVDLHVPAGQFVSIMGPSGSGKSTLLNLLGALDRPTTGSIEIGGDAIHALDDDGLTRVRREKIGFVFQFFNLLPTLTALENVMLPALLAGRAASQVEPDAATLLESVGLSGRAHHRPDELSGGEMQRVAVARALATRPRLVLADEPTGNLDSRTGAEILRLIRSVAEAHKVTVVMVTHDARAAQVGDRIVRVQDGRIVADEQAAGANAEILAGLQA